ncbi:unnamed protein product [Adineta steineri]|uniref:EGF-like domain-containing protein n=1 Tax=Adineta steineri TaxID=433720 RepID=A0A815RNU5_9BILA|nr:unnamed protein product [Adineta steineri]CAF1478303.1 unnamed protein product [Adineta steineri]CAF1480921.1 unnamed protein product [Adineta steineri]
MVNTVFTSKFQEGLHESLLEICYGSLTCTSLVCLDWREVCDGKWDCQDGVDEYGCSQIEANTCDQNEYQCHNGQCIPLEFYADDVVNPDCLDGTDEEPMFSHLHRHGSCSADPAFRCEEYGLSNTQKFPCGDGSYIMYPLMDIDSKQCENYRDRQVEKHFLSHAQNPLLTEKCCNPIQEHLCKLEDWMKPPVVPFALEFSETVSRGTAEYITMLAPTLDWTIVWFCNRGIAILERNVRRCLCPPSYYGERCQYQSQRVSLSFRITTLELRNIFNLVIMLVDNTSLIHSHEQRTYVAARDCDLRFDLVLLYANRTKDESKTYDIIIHAFEMLNYRTSWQLPVRFLSLPVYRISTLLTIPSEPSLAVVRCPIDCINGECVRYINTENFFCRCWQNWSGISCEKVEKCNCAPGSVCVGTYDKRSICVCSLDNFGPRCLLKHRVACQQQTLCSPNGTALCVPVDVKMTSNEGLTLQNGLIFIGANNFHHLDTRSTIDWSN